MLLTKDIRGDRYVKNVANIVYRNVKLGYGILILRFMKDNQFVKASTLNKSHCESYLNLGKNYKIIEYNFRGKRQGLKINMYEGNNLGYGKCYFLNDNNHGFARRKETEKYFFINM